MEVIIGLKFEVDEESLNPKLGNRYGGKIETALRNCVADVVSKFFDKYPDVTLTHSNVGIDNT